MKQPRDEDISVLTTQLEYLKESTMRISLEPLAGKTVQLNLGYYRGIPIKVACFFHLFTRNLNSRSLQSISSLSDFTLERDPSAGMTFELCIEGEAQNLAATTVVFGIEFTIQV